MTQLNPYVRFNDKKCKEAMNFYAKCLGGEVEFQTVGETPMAKEMPKETHGNIMHAKLTAGNIVLYGADMMRDKAVVGDNVSLSLMCESEKELQDLFKKLSKDGDVFMKPEKTFWGAIFGVVTDKYGVEWMLNFQVEPMEE